MALSKNDLAAIREIVRDETKPRFDEIENKIEKVDKKVDKMFNYLDSDVSYFRQKTAEYLGISVSDLIKPS